MSRNFSTSRKLFDRKNDPTVAPDYRAWYRLPFLCNCDMRSLICRNSLSNAGEKGAPDHVIEGIFRRWELLFLWKSIPETRASLAEGLPSDLSDQLAML